MQNLGGDRGKLVGSRVQSGCKRRCGTWVGMETGWVGGGCKTRVQGWARWDKTWVSDWAKYCHESPSPSAGRTWNPQIQEFKILQTKKKKFGQPAGAQVGAQVKDADGIFQSTLLKKS